MSQPLLEQTLQRLNRLLDRLEGFDPQPSDWSQVAYRWRNGLHPLPLAGSPDLDDLLFMDQQKDTVARNSEQFLRGLPANNVLLWGARGTGKSSLIKAILHRFADAGLRVIEVDKTGLEELPRITELIRPRPERFILYCDDLSFTPDEPGYAALKALLEGSIAAPPENLLIYATSNRRHLIPEYQAENQQSRLLGNEIHHTESVEEKISLSDRFGIWLSFYPYSQEQYLAICRHWLARLGCRGPEPEQLQRAALQWALKRGARSGRVAWQFARDWAGRLGLGKDD